MCASQNVRIIHLSIQNPAHQWQLHLVSLTKQIWHFSPQVRTRHSHGTSVKVTKAPPLAKTMPGLSFGPNFNPGKADGLVRPELKKTIRWNAMKHINIEVSWYPHVQNGMPGLREKHTHTVWYAGWWPLIPFSVLLLLSPCSRNVQPTVDSEAIT